MDAASAEFLRLYQEECRRQQEALNAAEVSLLSVRPCLGCTGRCAGAAAPACTRVRCVPTLARAGGSAGCVAVGGFVSGSEREHTTHMHTQIHNTLTHTVH